MGLIGLGAFHICLSSGRWIASHRHLRSLIIPIANSSLRCSRIALHRNSVFIQYRANSDAVAMLKRMVASRNTLVHIHRRLIAARLCRRTRRNACGGGVRQDEL